MTFWDFADKHHGDMVSMVYAALGCIAFCVFFRGVSRK